MRYSKIDFDVSNGLGCGYSLFVQGCDNYCEDCFNPETWDFDGGKEFTEETAERIIQLLDKPYITRLSILGGEPLHKNNNYAVMKLIESVSSKFEQSKEIWVYTGYKFEDLTPYQFETIAWADVLIDGRYEKDKRDITLPFRGSTNQRIIDIKKSLIFEDVVLWSK